MSALDARLSRLEAQSCVDDTPGATVEDLPPGVDIALFRSAGGASLVERYPPLTPDTWAQTYGGVHGRA